MPVEKMGTEKLRFIMSQLTNSARGTDTERSPDQVAAGRTGRANRYILCPVEFRATFAFGPIMVTVLT